MSRSLRIAFFGSSLVSACWNGAAAYYRGIIRALHARGHRVTFYEPAACERQRPCNMADPSWARVVVYENSAEAALRQMESAADADIIIKAGGVGAYDDLLDAAALQQKRASNAIVFWDVDAPATLDRVKQNPADPFRARLPRFDLVLTYGGGGPVTKAYRCFGARDCVPIYNALDETTHYPVPPEPAFAGTLAFLGNRLPDREARVDEFFFDAAERLPGKEFLLGGSGWQGRVLPPNVRYIGPVPAERHNGFNASPLAVLNLSRVSLAGGHGCSPATRLFEAAGAGACLITDTWDGIERFFEPGREVLVAASGEEVAAHLAALTPRRARQIGEAARHRALGEHTCARRVEKVERLFLDLVWS